MKVNDPNVIVGSSALASIKISDNKEIIITLKNNSTLTFKPQVVNNKVEGYEMIYLTGKENKQIAKLKEKINSLQLQIAEITEGNQNDNTYDDVE